VRTSLRVNGNLVQEEVEPRLTLADLLRDRLGLTGTHLGCEHGVCGACTVLLDGEAARSCLTLAVQASGTEVITVEGLDQPMLPRDLFQCGFCRAGFLVSAAAMASAGRRHSREELVELLAGNICRCTGYQPIVEALVEAQP
jgi:carbon-monoxide dehydrogenase small subunit